MGEGGGGSRAIACGVKAAAASGGVGGGGRGAAVGDEIKDVVDIDIEGEEERAWVEVFFL